MKIGFCTCMNPKSPDGIGMECLEQVAAAGYDYAEVPAAQLLALEDKALDQAVDRLIRCGLPVLAMNNLFQPQVKVTGPALDSRRVDEYIDRVIDLAGRVGVRTMVFGSSGARNVPMHFPHNQAWKQLVDMLKRLGDKARTIGATIVIEHLNHLESNIVDWFSEGVRLVKEVNHPAVRCLVDFYHLDLGNETLDAVEENIALIHHAHFANTLQRTVPTPERHEQRGVDFLTILKKLGYAHAISVEGYSSNPDEEIPASRQFIQTHSVC